MLCVWAAIRGFQNSESFPQNFKIWIVQFLNWDTWWRSWLRHYVKRRQVVGSNPDGVIRIFNSRNPSGHTMSMGVDSASNRNEYQEYFLGVKVAGA